MRYLLFMLLLAPQAALAAGVATLVCEGTGAITWNGQNNILTCSAGPTPPIPPDPPQTKCVAGDIIITGVWNTYGIETRDHGNFSTSNVLAVQLKPPATWVSSGAAASWVEYIQGGGNRNYVISRVPCSFDDADALRLSDGRVYKGYTSPGFTVRYKSGAASGDYVGLEPGQTYWINARNQNPSGTSSCPAPTNGCNMRGSVRQ